MTRHVRTSPNLIGNDPCPELAMDVGTLSTEVRLLEAD